MSDITENAGLNYNLDGSEPDYFTKVNDNYKKIDALLPIGVLDQIDIGDLPGSPVDGDKYIVDGSFVYIRANSAWLVTPLLIGSVFFDINLDKLFYFSGIEIIEILDTPDVTFDIVSKQSLSSGTFSTISDTAVPVTNLTNTITTTGNRVLATIVPIGIDSFFKIVQDQSTGSGANDIFETDISIELLRDGSIISNLNIEYSYFTKADQTTTIPVTINSFVDKPIAGTYTYSINAKINQDVHTSTLHIENFSLVLETY